MPDAMNPELCLRVEMCALARGLTPKVRYAEFANRLCRSLRDEDFLRLMVRYRRNSLLTLFVSNRQDSVMILVPDSLSFIYWIARPFLVVIRWLKDRTACDD